jgi:hypothetical protein
MIPVPGLVGASVFSSIHPLKTDPKPPAPSTLSGLKFLVATLSSLKVKALTFADSRISSSLRGGGTIDADEAWLLEPLKAAPFVLENLEVPPDNQQETNKDFSDFCPPQLFLIKLFLFRRSTYLFLVTLLRGSRFTDEIRKSHVK